MLERLVVFGVGDLTRRYLLPALVDLECHDILPTDFHVVAAGRDRLDTAAFREQAAAALTPQADRTPPDARRRLLDRLAYRQADVTDAASVAAAVDAGEGPLAVYLALPPAVFPAAVRNLAAAGLPAGSCLAVEKPFGTDLASARELNRLIRGCLPEQAVFRVDHFLGIHTVQNLLDLRFANRVFEPVWNAQHVDRVEIVWDETVTLEGRGYYDTVGALRDMVQNHLLQLLALVAMEPPAAMGERDLRDRKADVLRAVRRLSAEDVAERTVRACYTAGRIGDRDVPAYTDEEHVDTGRGTETFAQVTPSTRRAPPPLLSRPAARLRPGPARHPPGRPDAIHPRRRSRRVLGDRRADPGRLGCRRPAAAHLPRRLQRSPGASGAGSPGT